MGIYRRLTTTDGADSAILTTSDTYMTVTADSYELEDLQITPKIEAQKFKSEAYLRNAVGSVPDHLSKTNVTIKV